MIDDIRGLEYYDAEDEVYDSDGETRVFSVSKQTGKILVKLGHELRKRINVEGTERYCFRYTEKFGSDLLRMGLMNTKAFWDFMYVFADKAGPAGTLDMRIPFRI